MPPLIPRGLCDTTDAPRGLTSGRRTAAELVLELSLASRSAASSGSVSGRAPGTATGTGTAPMSERSAWASGRALVSTTETRSTDETMAEGVVLLGLGVGGVLSSRGEKQRRRKT